MAWQLESTLKDLVVSLIPALGSGSQAGLGEILEELREMVEGSS